MAEENFGRYSAWELKQGSAQGAFMLKSWFVNFLLLVALNKYFNSRARVGILRHFETIAHFRRCAMLLFCFFLVKS